MKRFCAIVVVLLAFGLYASSQTNVSGFINVNTTWTLAGSPYVVTGNALLSQGYTLTIDPGVVVKFDSNKALQIDGQLIAIGTVTQRIVFTSNQSSPQPGDWAKLHFSDYSIDAVYNAQGNYVSGTIMKYCDVLYAGSLMWGSVDIQQCSPYFNHCRIMYGGWSGINFNADNFTIDSSRISDCPKRGIDYTGGHFLMRNDTFISNGEGAIHIQQSGDTVQSRILDSYFRFNSMYGAVSWLNNGLQRVTITGNKFANNSGTVIAVRGSFDTISCNSFTNNTGGAAIEFGDMGYPHAGGVIHNNIIEYNVNNGGPSVFSIGAGYYSGMGDTLYISNNTVRHNSSPGNSCCDIRVDLFSPTTESLQIYNNEFSENDGVNFMKLYGAQNNNPSFNFMYLRNNTFINPLCTYELNNNIPYGSPNLQIAYNYWGNSSTTYVDGVIYDYFDLASQSVAYYMPILTFPIAVDTACQPFMLPVGVEDFDAASVGKLGLYPNPTNGSFSINFSDVNQSREGKLEILNSLGEVVTSVDLSETTSKDFVLPGSSGIYFVRVITKENSWVEKIVKE